MSRDNRMARAIVDYLPDPPPHICSAASAVYSDLVSGPVTVRIPHGDVTQFDDDVHSYGIPSDAHDDAEPGDVIENAYAGRVGAALRDYIESLPSSLYYDDDCEHVTDCEPEGEWIDTGETDDDGAPVTEWCDPSPYYAIDRDDIVAALFGRTIAREF